MDFDRSNHQASSFENALIFANFNQDYSSIVVGSRNGYQVYQIASPDNLDLIFNKREPREVNLVDRLFSSSLVSLVNNSSPRRLDVCHFKKGTEICNYNYPNSILAVKMNRLRLIVMLEESIYIHNIRDMKVLHVIRNAPSNPKGLCCLSINNDRTFMAYPGSSATGEVQIFDVTTLNAVNTINAHNTSLAAMVFNAVTNKIATASGKGTVIRVFSVPDGQKLFEFRRGVSRCVTIASLCFSPDSLFLCASSNTETIHIFKLEHEPVKKNVVPKESSSWMGYLNKAISNSASYLPTQVTEVFYQDRAFATVKLSFSGVKNISAIVALQKLPRILAIGGDGFLYIYNLDPVDGGECTLLHKHSLSPVGHAHEASSDEVSSSSSTFPERDFVCSQNVTYDSEASDHNGLDE